MIPSTMTRRASNPACGTSASFRMIPISNPCATAMPMTPCATERMVAPASFRKSSLRSRRRATESFWRRQPAAAPPQQKPGQGHGNENFRCRRRRLRQVPGSCQRLELQRHLPEQRTADWSTPVPERKDLRADDRPLPDLRRRRCNGERPRAELRSEAAQPLDGAETEPGRRADDNREVDDGEESGGPFRPAAEHAREPLEDGIERDRQHHAPGQDRHERTDHHERPVDQENEQREAHRKLDFVFAGQQLADRSQSARSQTKLFQVRRLPAKPRTAD